MTSKVSMSKRFILNGIFGVMKEAGDSVDDYRQWIRLTHYHESQIHAESKPWNSPSLTVDINPRYIDPLSTGVLCVGLGFWSTKLTALTHFWPHEWIVRAKLGTQTQDYWSGSEVTKQMSFDHVTEQMLNDNLAKFVGQIEQYNPPFIWKENLLIPKVEKVEKANLMAKTSKKNDKRVAVPRIRQCHSIELLAFQPPNFKMKVVSDGLFSCRALVNDLGGQLNSCAHLTQLHLNKMGVITEDICLKKYELHFTYIRDAVQKYSNLFKNDLKKYQDLKTLRRGVV